MPARKSPRRMPVRLLRSLHLIGLDFLDPVVLAALADERPLLLIGPHGTAKSELLNRLATCLGLAHRHYNASLISFDDSKDAAVADLRDLLTRYRNIDVGLMQVNLQWHGHRATPDALLDAGTNLDVAAAILAAAIASAPGDPELGIGRYHHWRNETVARAYGRRVLAVVQALQLRHSAHR